MSLDYNLYIFTALQIIICTTLVTNKKALA